MQNSKFIRGFTLIELLVSITIIGIMVGLSIPTIRNFQASSSITQSAQELKFEINRAYASAVRENRVYIVNFAAPDNKKYTVQRIDGMVTVTVKTVALKPGTVFTSPASSIRYTASGQIAVIPGVITLGYKNRTTTINVMTATGEVIIR